MGDRTREKNYEKWLTQKLEINVPEDRFYEKIKSITITLHRERTMKKQREKKRIKSSRVQINKACNEP